MLTKWGKGKSAIAALLLIVAVLAPPRWMPFAQSVLAPLSKALPDEVVYEGTALLNVYKIGPGVSAPTPLLSKWAAPDHEPYARWDRGATSFFSTAALERPLTTDHDRPLYIRENDPTHTQASRILVVKLDDAYWQQEFRTLPINFVTAVSTVACFDEQVEKRVPAQGDGEATASIGWLADIHAAWQANLAAITDLNVIQPKGAASLVDLPNGSLKHADGAILTANTPFAPYPFSGDGKPLHPMSDCSGIRARWSDS